MTAEIERAKNRAARAALEAYRVSLLSFLAALDFPADALDDTRHVHVALFIDPSSGATVLVRAEWSSTTNHVEIAAALARAPVGGSG
jgi:hypothetical protein